MKLISTIGAAILFIIALISIVLGFLFVLGSSSPQGSSGWTTTGIVIIGFGILCTIGGIVLVYLARKRARLEASESVQNVSLNIDLPGEMKIESMKCQSCGGELASKDIQMIAGAPVVTCPYCGTTYQLTEEPKW